MRSGGGKSLDEHPAGMYHVKRWHELGPVGAEYQEAMRGIKQMYNKEENE